MADLHSEAFTSRPEDGFPGLLSEPVLEQPPPSETHPGPMQFRETTVGCQGRVPICMPIFHPQIPGEDLCLLKVPVPVLAKGLEYNGADGHEWLHHTELQGGLLGRQMRRDKQGCSASAPPLAAGPMLAARKEEGTA